MPGASSTGAGATASFRVAGGLWATGVFVGFAGLRGIAMVLGNLEIASQLLRMVVVVSYIYFTYNLGGVAMK